MEKTDLFLTKFDEYLERLHKNNTTYFVMGDANFNLLKINHNLSAKKYLDTVHSNGFTNGIFKATRIQGLSFSLIDHILMKNEPENTKCNTIISDLSDHFITAVSYSTTKPTRIQKTMQTRTIDVGSMREFRAALNSMSWNHVSICNDTNTEFDEFFSTFIDLFELYFPLINKKISKNKTPVSDFMTAGLLISRRRKELLHRWYLKNRTDENFTIYKRYQNLYNSILKESKKLTIEKQLILNNNKKPRKIWQIYNELINRSSSNSKIDNLIIHGQSVTDEKSIAEEFNNFFSTVGENPFLSQKLYRNPIFQ